MKKILMVASECVPFVKTGGLADVVGALPKALVKEGCDVRVVLPNYRCIPEHYRNDMEYVNHFYMDLGHDAKMMHVGIMKYEMDNVTFYFIDNEDYFGIGNPYTEMSNDIVKFVFFSKAALSILPVIDFKPDIIHCHDWQAALVPIFLHTTFKDHYFINNIKTIMTVHNLKFQGIANINTMKFFTGFPSYVFSPDQLEFNKDANMLKGGLVYADKITTVSDTYAGEIKTFEYGEGLNGVIGYHHMKLSGIVNGIDYDIYNPSTDKIIYKNYDSKNVKSGKTENKLKLQEELGLERNPDKFMIALISRLTDQKGLDLVNQVMDSLIDGNTQFVLIGTGDDKYENMFRYYENKYKGQVCSNIMYSDDRAHKLYAAADVILVPSRFEPCGLTQLISLRYGTVPIVRETGGLKDTVIPYNEYSETGNGFSFTFYDPWVFLSVINYAKTVYFERKSSWDGIVKHGMEMDYSWTNAAKNYKALYESI